MRTSRHSISLAGALAPVSGLIVVVCAVAYAAAAGAAPAGAAGSATAVEARPEALAQAQVKAQASAAARPRIVFLGDSLTAGYGLARHESVPSLIQVRLNSSGYHYDVVNAGVSGDTTAGGLSRLDWSLSGDVQVLVVELGANDGLRGLPVTAMKSNLDQIIRRARQRGITVLLTGMEAPPNYGAVYTKEFRQAFQDLAQTHKVPFIPFFLQGVAGIPSLNIADGIHPNPAGARIVEANVWRALQPLLTKPR